MLLSLSVKSSIRQKSFMSCVSFFERLDPLLFSLGKDIIEKTNRKTKKENHEIHHVL